MVRKSQDTEPEEEPVEITWTPDNTRGRHIVFAGPKGSQYPQQIGQITKHYKKDAYHISHIGHEHEFKINNPANYAPVFPTIESAANALWVIRQAINQNPFTDSMRSFVIQEADELRKRQSHLCGEFIGLDFKRARIKAFAEKYGLDIEVDVEISKEVDDLVQFLDEHMESIYNTFGKDWARSLRALISSVVRRVDPITANKL